MCRRIARIETATKSREMAPRQPPRALAIMSLNLLLRQEQGQMDAVDRLGEILAHVEFIILQPTDDGRPQIAA